MSCVPAAVATTFAAVRLVSKALQAFVEDGMKGSVTELHKQTLASGIVRWIGSPQ
jgi:hypothetical protein